MVENRTAIVVGAGASAECKLPTGAELKHQIARLLDIRFKNGEQLISGDGTICRSLAITIRQSTPPEQDINEHLHAAWRIRDAMPQALSIDNFIDAHQGNSRLELCGKLGIVRSILEAEKNSALYFDTNDIRGKLRFEQLGDTWLAVFFKLLTENCRIHQLVTRLSKLSFIIFNYDRCVEHYLFHAFQNYYGVNANQAAELMSHLAIFHPYGTVGALPWQNTLNSIDYGKDPSAEELIQLVGQIRTFAEGTDSSTSSIGTIRKQLLDAHTILFLGFAYHKLNIELLKTGGLTHREPQSTKYFGTAIGISPSDCELITGELHSLGSAPVEQIYLRRDLTSAKLFGEYWRSLSRW